MISRGSSLPFSHFFFSKSGILYQNLTGSSRHPVNNYLLPPTFSSSECSPPRLIALFLFRILYLTSSGAGSLRMVSLIGSPSAIRHCSNIEKYSASFVLLGSVCCTSALSLISKTSMPKRAAYSVRLISYVAAA